MALAKKAEQDRRARRKRAGFIGDRMLTPYLREAQFLLEEGASVEDVNNALTISGRHGTTRDGDLAGTGCRVAHPEGIQHLEKPGVRVPW